MSIKISEIEEIFNEVFEEEKGLVNSVETVYETPEEDSDCDDDLSGIVIITGFSIIGTACRTDGIFDIFFN